jgi:hypothetical protein
MSGWLDRLPGYQMKTRAIHEITDCHGRLHIQKQRRWRSHGYKVRRAIMKLKRMTRASKVNPDFESKAVATWNLLVKYGCDTRRLQ